VDDDASIIVGLAPTLLVVFDAVIAQVIDRHDVYAPESNPVTGKKDVVCFRAL
jgi:hypothetical protein